MHFAVHKCKLEITVKKSSNRREFAENLTWNEKNLIFEENLKYHRSENSSHKISIHFENVFIEGLHMIQ